MKCNIDEKGRRARRNGGIVSCAAAAVLLCISFFVRRDLVALLLIGLALLACGLFQLYEARKGWCVLRAMGMKTRI